MADNAQTEKGDSSMNDYKVFTRTWWRADKNGSLVPHIGPKSTIGRATTEREAQEICEEYNSSHSPGRLSRKAEYMAE